MAPSYNFTVSADNILWIYVIAGKSNAVKTAAAAAVAVGRMIAPRVGKFDYDYYAMFHD